MLNHKEGDVELTAPPVDNVLDLHGDPLHAGLVIFLNGNQWMVMEELLAAFYQEHPEIKNIFYETIPPGILLQQIRRGRGISRLHEGRAGSRHICRLWLYGCGLNFNYYLQSLFAVSQ